MTSATARSASSAGTASFTSSRPEGNPKARLVIDRLLEPSEALWRGIGTIGAGGLALRRKFGGINAEDIFGMPEVTNHEPPGCLCARVIQGKALPTECPHFAGRCTPERPVGPCMVSSEGSCAAYLHYGSEGLRGAPG